MEPAAMLFRGRPVHPGVITGPTRQITAHDLADLHHSKRHAELDQELREIFRSPDFRIHSLSDLGGTGLAPVQDDKKMLLEVTFWSAVNDLLENRGSGIVFAVASVVSRYLRSAIFSLDQHSQEEFRCLADLGKSVLAGLLKFRQAKYPTSQSYIVLASSLNLPEAVSLEPRIVGYALGISVDVKIQIASELLGVPAVAGLEGIDEHVHELQFVRLDGDAGTLETVTEGHSRIEG